MPITRQFKDLNLAFTRHPITGDVARHLDTRSIIESVKALVFTKHYERPMHPEIGCDVTAMLFENIEQLTAIRIKKSIEEVLNNFEPRVSVIGVTVSANSDQNAYNALIVFSINNRPEPISLPLILERLR